MPIEDVFPAVRLRPRCDMNECDSTLILPDIVDELVTQVDDLGLDVASFWADDRPRHDPGPRNASPPRRDVRSEFR